MARAGLTVAPGWLTGAGEGLVVRTVKPNSLAAIAKLRPGDRILSAGGVAVGAPNALAAAIEAAEGTVSLRIVPAGGGAEANVVLARPERQ